MAELVDSTALLMQPIYLFNKFSSLVSYIKVVKVFNSIYRFKFLYLFLLIIFNFTCLINNL